MSLNNNVVVTVVAEDPPVTGAAFGTPAILANPGDALFSPNRVAFYTTAGAVETARFAGDLSDDLASALTAGLAQSPHTPRVAALRADDTGSVQVITWTVGGTPAAGEIFNIRVNGILAAFTAGAAPTPSTVATGLRAELINVLTGEPVTVSGAAAEIIVTADSLTDFFDYAEDTDSIAGTLVVAVTEAGIDVAGSLGLAAAESSEWYGLTLQSYASAHISLAATWAEANSRLLVAQSNDPNILAVTTIDIAAILMGLSLQRTAVLYHPVRSEQVALMWMSTTLAADPDAQTTIWAYKTLEGATQSAINATQKTNLESKNANIYSTFYGRGATWDGKVASGQFMDVRITTDWVVARSAEAFASLLLRVSNLNLKIPYNNRGIEQAAASVRGVLLRGEAVGHFNAGQTEVIKPDIDDVPAIDKANRIVRLEFVAELAGAIQGGAINGFLVLTFPA